MKFDLSVARLAELTRYYQAGIINAAFGFGFYATLVRLGLNIYFAQVTATVIGTLFNYFTYSRHVFRGYAPEKWSFIAVYFFNYLVSVSMLFALKQFIASPYQAGFVGLIIASLINYVALKLAVFRKRV